MAERLPVTGIESPGNASALLDAVLAISSDLDLHSVLLRIVKAACDLTDAQYGALGVLGDQGLSDFLTFGIDDEGRTLIGDLPRGHGILGLLIDHPEPLRLSHLQEHPQSYGFPPNHPPMERFLGVPVRIRGTVFGNLYLTDKRGGEDFTEQDEVMVGALAAAAGLVIENARAYAQSERRRQWLEATAQLGEALHPPIHPEEALLAVAIGARRVAGASGVAAISAGEDPREVVALDGLRADEVPDLVAGLGTRLAEAERGGELVVVPRGAERTVVVLPLRAHLAENGTLLIVLEGGRGSLDAQESELLESFADQAALAFDRAHALSERQELMLISDRDRIARDLHDLVIQRLFATGLQLQGARRFAVSEDVIERIDRAVDDLDVTIRDIRSTIFELQHSRKDSVRADVRGVAKEYAPVLGFSPVVRTTGPVDSTVPRSVGDQLLAVLREALSNVARHAQAGAAVVEVEASADQAMLRVSDNGRGMSADRYESGLRNVRRRAAELGGTLRLAPGEPQGTVLEWRVPLSGEQAG